MVEQTERLLLKVDEAAAALGISRSKLHHLIASGQIRTVRIGPRCQRVSIDELRRFIAQREADQDQ